MVKALSEVDEQSLFCRVKGCVSAWEESKGESQRRGPRKWERRGMD